MSAVVNAPVKFEDGGVVDQVVFRVYVGFPHRGRSPGGCVSNSTFSIYPRFSRTRKSAAPKFQAFGLASLRFSFSFCCFTGYHAECPRVILHLY